MTQRIRASIRLVLFFIASLLTVIFVGVGNLLLGIINESWAVKWKNGVIKRWAAVTARIIGMQLKVKGTPPKPPFFLVANHLSYIDVVPLWYYLDATFIAKSDIKSWPFFGWATKTLGVLFINRELKRDVKRMNRRISNVLTEEQGVILFPEGTSTKGETVKPFNAPLLQYPATQSLAVNYATISYDTGDSALPAHLNVCWWGEMEFFPHFWNLLKMKRFKAQVTFGDGAVHCDNRKELARNLHKSVTEVFTPTVIQN